MYEALVERAEATKGAVHGAVLRRYSRDEYFACLERLRAARHPCQLPSQEACPMPLDLFLGQPHTGHEATQLGCGRLLDLGWVALPQKEQPGRVGEIPGGDVCALGIASDMQPSVPRRELHERRAPPAGVER